MSQNQTRAHEMLELYNSGLTLREVGERYGRTRQLVHSIISRLPEYKAREKAGPTKMCGDCQLVSLPVRFPRCKGCSTIRKNLWAPNTGVDACVGCHKTTYRHVARGLCVYCWIHEDEDRLRRWKASQKKYHTKNREKIKARMQVYMAERRKRLKVQ